MSEEHTGGSSSYYSVWIENPTTEGRPQYFAECNDIIEALNMTYAEANVFKANWRKAAERTLGLKKKGNNAVYDAEKMVFFSKRTLVQEVAKQAKPPLKAAEIVEPIGKLVGKDSWKEGQAAYEVKGGKLVGYVSRHQPEARGKIYLCKTKEETQQVALTYYSYGMEELTKIPPAPGPRNIQQL